MSEASWSGITTMDIRSFDYNTAATVTHALSNPARLHAVLLLARAEMSVGAISESLGLSQSSVSQHLKRLRDLNLVETRRENQTIFYSVPKLAPVRKIIEVLGEIDQLASEGNRPGDNLPSGSLMPHS